MSKFKSVFNLLQSIRYQSNYTKICNIGKNQLGETLTIKGWVKAHRNMKSFVFLDVNDGSTVKNIQVLINKQDKIPNIGYGASVNVSGKLCELSSGQLEIHSNSCSVLGECIVSDGYPFVPKQNHPSEYQRNYLHLRSRINTFSSMLRVRHHAIKAFNDYLSDQGLFQVHTPILTSNDCEGAGEVFTVKPDNTILLKQMVQDKRPIDEAFFNKKIYLSVSGQLHLESMCYGLGNVYTFGPTFRAENSRSTLHLSEFYMLEAEYSFLDQTKDLASKIENMIKYVTKYILDNCEADIDLIKNKNKSRNSSEFENEFSWLGNQFPLLTYIEAVEILRKNSNKLKAEPPSLTRVDGLSKEHELFLVNYCKGPVFIIDWPTKIKPFYMRQNTDNLDIVDALDLLTPMVGELAGGSIREDNYEMLQIKLPSNDLKWYLELRKFGGVTTGGFGLGFERYLQFILDISNIKDVIPFPRWPHNCTM